MISFVDQPWFHRLWGWQEAILASPQTIACEGHQHVLWEQVYTAVFYFSWIKEPPVLQGTCEITEALTRIRASLYYLCSALPQNQFNEIMQYTRHSKCIDPRESHASNLGVGRSADSLAGGNRKSKSA
jgi:hypothetical protein